MFLLQFANKMSHQVLNPAAAGRIVPGDNEKLQEVIRILKEAGSAVMPYLPFRWTKSVWNLFVRKGLTNVTAALKGALLYFPSR